jgi:tRNA-guanine family transglycosylase
MFDCVYPTRTARFGTALVASGTLNLRDRKCAADFSPIEDVCECETCKTYSRSYIYSLLLAKCQTAGCLISVHNVAYQLRIMGEARTAIIEARFPAYVRAFMAAQFPKGAESVPQWVNDALKSVNITLDHPKVEAAVN